MFRAEIKVDNEIICLALKPDIYNDKDVEIIDNTIIIKAEKISDLRAKINSYLRLIDVAIHSLDLD